MHVKAPKAVIKVFLAGHTVAMVTYYITKIIIICSPITGRNLDSMILMHQVIQSGYNDPSESNCWKLFTLALSYYQ